ncbi:MAG: GNAT family N-acetyltransferase [Acidobacteria bacterium]|nr:GNAT family N-acetyltransferase [Acidobacteriota bacterium]
MIVCTTDRLVLRLLSVEDAEFILELLNEPSWLRFIGDKGVRTLDDARSYIATGPVAMYERHGFGLYVTERREDGVPMGICGLIKRDWLDDVDIGFAFLPRFWGRGYAHEAAAAVMDYGRNVLGIGRIVAITSPDNATSARLLEKLGLRFDRMIQMRDDGTEDRLFVPDE